MFLRAWFLKITLPPTVSTESTVVFVYSLNHFKLTKYVLYFYPISVVNASCHKKYNQIVIFRLFSPFWEKQKFNSFFIIPLNLVSVLLYNFNDDKLLLTPYNTQITYALITVIHRAYKCAPYPNNFKMAAIKGDK